MTSIEQTSALLTTFGSKKLFSSFTAALAVISAPTSVGWYALFSEVIGDTPMKDLLLPILVAFATLALYWIVYALDLFTGIKAARKEGEAVGNPNWFKSNKGWSSIIKMFIITIMVTWLAFFSILAAIGKFPYLPTGFLLMSAGIGILGTMMDLHSIGENQKRLTGKKSEIFTWLEKLNEVIKEGIIVRTQNFFKK